MNKLPKNIGFFVTYNSIKQIFDVCLFLYLLSIIGKYRYDILKFLFGGMDTRFDFVVVMLITLFIVYALYTSSTIIVTLLYQILLKRIYNKIYISPLKINLTIEEFNSIKENMSFQEFDKYFKKNMFSWQKLDKWAHTLIKNNLNQKRAQNARQWIFVDNDFAAVCNGNIAEVNPFFNIYFIHSLLGMD